MDATSNKEIQHKVLIDWIRLHTPKLSAEGVCNGVTSMWIQAIITSKEEEANFYKRLDFLSAYLSKPNNTLAKLKKEVEDLFESQKNLTNDPNFKRKPLTDEELDKIDLRAFADSVAIQQDVNTINLFENRIPQVDKSKLYPFSTSAMLERGTDIRLMSELPQDKKLAPGKMYVEKAGDRLKYTLLGAQGEMIEDFLDISVENLTKESLHKLKASILEETSTRGHTSKIRSDVVGVVGLNQAELEKYLENIKGVLEKDNQTHPEKRGAFLLCSDNHAIGLYLDTTSGKWHFYDINHMSGKTEYYFSVSSAELAPLIFKSFFDDSNGNTVFYSQYISTYHDDKLVASLKKESNKVLESSINKKNARGYNTFLASAYIGEPSTISALLKTESERNALIDKTFTDMVTAFEQKKMKEAEGLYNKLASIVEIRMSWYTCSILLKDGRVASLKDALTIGKTDLAKSTTQKDSTALIVAVHNGRIETVKALLSVDPKLDSKVFLAAVYNGEVELVKLLLSSDPKTNAEELRKIVRAAFLVAAQNGRLEMFKFLLTLDPKPNLEAKDTKGETALMLAVINGQVDMVKFLLSFDPKPNLELKNKEGETALMLAAKNGQIEMVKFLLSLDPKTDINTVNNQGWTALNMAVHAGQTEVVKALISSEPKPNLDILNKHGWSALMTAAYNGHTEIVKTLLSADPKPNLKAVNKHGSARKQAAKQGHSDIAQLLLNAELRVAASKGSLVDLNVALVNQPKPNLDEADEKGMTALMLAVKHGHLKIVQALLANDPPPNFTLVNLEGKSVQELALENGNEAIIKLFGKKTEEKSLSGPQAVFLPKAKSISTYTSSAPKESPKSGPDAPKDIGKKI